MDIHEALNSAIEEITRANGVMGRQKSQQVKSQEEKNYLKSVVYSWKRTYSPIVTTRISESDLLEVESQYTLILEATSKNAARSTYFTALKKVKEVLIRLRSNIFVSQSSIQTLDVAPDFTPLVADQAMKDILVGRWEECRKCLNADANLAATVMMGGLLEALFVARANKMADKGPLFRVKSTPRDPKTKKPMALKEWTLSPYIDVGYELGWIRKPGRDVATILRDYRNYIHPEKERSHGISLKKEDSIMFWEITKSLVRQLLTIA